MRNKGTNLRKRHQMKSILLAFVLIVINVVVVFSLTSQEARAQPIEHRASTADEDGIWPFDTDFLENGVVVWSSEEDHHITQDYTVDSGYTLVIPALNFMDDPEMSQEISFKTTNTQIEVWGTLITNSDNNELTKTLFWGENIVDWQGIYFRPGSAGNITDCFFMGADNALVLSKYLVSSTLLYPGITDSIFMDMKMYGVRLQGVVGYRNIEGCAFEDTYNSAIGIEVIETDLDVKGCSFNSHGNNESSLFIRDAKVYCADSSFRGNYQPGNEVIIERQGSSGSILERCTFWDGAPGDYFLSIDGADALINNCSFDTSHDELSAIANVKNGIPGRPIIRNPSGDGSSGFWDDSFDNTTMNATGDSSVTLQWYMDVFVEDTDVNPVDNALVRVNDSFGDPVEPPSLKTDVSGWARSFVVTELVQYNDSMIYYNPFNASALNNSMKGYAYPEVAMDMSKEVNITVPLNPIPNIPPDVVFNTVPVGIQGGLITIQYMVIDMNEGESGILSVMVFFSTDLNTWYPATQADGDSTDYLDNNTVYTFIWDSDTEADLANTYNETVYIMIVPYDGYGPGNPQITDNFTVDNKPPVLTLPPTVTVGNDWTLIEWTVDEPANAIVHYGLFVDGSPGDLTHQQSGSILTKVQSVNLTGLLSGRKYTFVVNSTDNLGNTGSSYPAFPPFTFITEVHIALYEGWNMISVPPFLPNLDPEVVLASIAGDWIAVLAYEAGDPDDPWKQKVAGKPFGNDLNWILPEMGLWILMNNESTLIPDQILPDPEGPPYVVLLLEGWNFVGYPSAETRTVADALAGISYSLVMTYDAATGDWLENDGPGGETDTLIHMEMGRGYWIYSTSTLEQEWSLPYTD